MTIDTQSLPQHKKQRPPADLTKSSRQLHNIIKLALLHLCDDNYSRCADYVAQMRVIMSEIHSSYRKAIVACTDKHQRYVLSEQLLKCVDRVDECVRAIKSVVK